MMLTAYRINPIDWGWDLLPSVEKVAAKIAALSAHACVAGDDMLADFDLADFLDDLRQAKQLALEKGWQADFRIGPKVLWFPDDGGFAYGFVWKQDDDGTTFVVAPRPLPWLDQLG